MPLTADDFIQENTGSTSSLSTSCVVTLPSGTTAGNTLFVFIMMKAASTITPATGFSLDTSTGTGALLAFHKSDVAVSETSWTFTSASTAYFAWYVAEVSNVDLVEPFDASAGSGVIGSTSNGGTRSTGTTSLNAGLSSVAFALFGAQPASGGASWSGYTNSFGEIADVPPGGEASLAVARKFQDGSTTTFESTATFATGGAATNTAGLMVVYRSADSSVVAPLSAFTGFEFGHHGGMGNTSGNNPQGSTFIPVGTWGTSYQVGSSYARNGGYGLHIVTSAATGNVPIGTMSAGSGSYGFNVRVVSGSGVVVVARMATSSGNHLEVVYDVSATKYGLRWGTGTPAYQSGTTALNTWVWIDVRGKWNGATWHAEWRIETAANTYTAETSPADLTGMTGVTNQGLLTLGSLVAQTMTADYDDPVASRYYAAYPLGPHKVSLLVPETTGASVSGTSGNFNEFTANGTLAAFASTSGQRIDEVPPTISASADGVAQVTLAASDYMQFPMGTYTCAYNEVIAAVRALFAEWGGTGTGTGTIGYRGWDGTTETTFVAASASYDADSLTAASSTYPIWKQAMWSSPNGWTQAELDAAALRVGFSTDATPDMGIHAAYLEVAIKTVDAARQVTLEDPLSATVDLYVHPYTSSTVSYVITNYDAANSVNFNYSISGTPQTPVTVTAGSSSTLQLNADAFGDISDVGLEPA